MARAATKKSLEAIQGVIESISRPFNGGWRFLTVRCDREAIKVNGTLPDGVEVGDFCSFQGRWTASEKYGDQFRFEQVCRETPKDIRGIQNYLDQRFKWVGPSVSRALVQRFGDKLFDVIERRPMELVQVNGITAARALEMQHQYKEIKLDQEQDLWFSTHGITPNMQLRLVDRYQTKANAVKAIQQNPYRLADEVWGVGFKSADTIALSMGIAKDSQERLRAGILYLLHEASAGKGHTCLREEDLVFEAGKLLEGNGLKIKEALTSLLDRKRVVRHGNYVYDPRLLAQEQYIARRLRALVAAHHEQMLNELSAEDLATMGEDQRRGLDLALASKILVITGGPGVGKTWLVDKIIRAIGGNPWDVALAAPTGKAAKRMYEATGREACTIHRLLEFSPIFGGFRRDESHPLDCKTLVIDETSMLDTPLMAALLAGINPTKTQVIFVGDVDQLPSVGPGRILADMIESEIIPTVRLTKLYRTAEASMINTNAQLINAGKSIAYVKGEGQIQDFMVVPEDDKDHLAAMIVKACERFSKVYDFSMKDIQVLAPQKKGPAGIVELNKALRPTLNPDGQPIPGTTYMTGDRVIQLRNNYDLDLFNGDIGEIFDANGDGLHIHFEEPTGTRKVIYPTKNLDDLQLAYALTVHKSQGSEFPVVIMPVHTTNYIMLVRNLLYTGVTRARKYVILVGTTKAINLAIQTEDSSKRFTNLARFLRDESIPEPQAAAAGEPDEWFDGIPFEGAPEPAEPDLPF